MSTALAIYISVVLVAWGIFWLVVLEDQFRAPRAAITLRAWSFFRTPNVAESMFGILVCLLVLAGTVNALMGVWEVVP